MALLPDLAGVPIVENIQVGVETEAPTPVEVEALWRRVVDWADKCDMTLAKISAVLIKLKKWKGKGLVTDDEMEQSETWLKHKRGILNYLLRGRWDNTFWEDTWIDGGGI